MVAAVILAGIVAFQEGPGGLLNPYRAQVSYVSWFDQNGNYLGDSPGRTVNAGASFIATLALVCPQWPLNCNSTESLNFGAIAGLGETGWDRGFVVTSSNMPVSLPPGGSASVSITVSVPNHPFSGWIRVTVNVAT